MYYLRSSLRLLQRWKKSYERPLHFPFFSSSLYGAEGVRASGVQLQNACRCYPQVKDPDLFFHKQETSMINWKSKRLCWTLLERNPLWGSVSIVFAVPISELSQVKNRYEIFEHAKYVQRWSNWYSSFCFAIKWYEICIIVEKLWLLFRMVSYCDFSTKAYFFLLFMVQMWSLEVLHFSLD